jgi:hypothetical protein
MADQCHAALRLQRQSVALRPPLQIAESESSHGCTLHAIAGHTFDGLPSIFQRTAAVQRWGQSFAHHAWVHSTAKDGLSMVQGVLDMSLPVSGSTASTIPKTGASPMPTLLANLTNVTVRTL